MLAQNALLELKRRDEKRKCLLRTLSTLRGLRGAPEVPPLCRETQSLGQQMLNAPLGINGLINWNHIISSKSQENIPNSCMHELIIRLSTQLILSSVLKRGIYLSWNVSFCINTICANTRTITVISL